MLFKFNFSSPAKFNNNKYNSTKKQSQNLFLGFLCNHFSCFITSILCPLCVIYIICTSFPSQYSSFLRFFPFLSFPFLANARSGFCWLQQTWQAFTFTGVGESTETEMPCRVCCQGKVRSLIAQKFQVSSMGSLQMLSMSGMHRKTRANWPLSTKFEPPN